ncbi:MAG: hypothetical protein JXQ87_02150 [Bacteroidia bacterium]
MSDNLEKFIKENRRSFDGETPRELVWKGVKKEIAKPEKRQNVIRINRRFFWAAAAVLVFAFSIILYQGGIIRSLKHNQVEVASTLEESNWQMPSELKTLDDTYIQQVSLTMNLLESFPDEQIELKEELTELDAEFELLKGEFGAEVSSEDVLNAMIENYRIKLDLLEVTLEYFKRSEKIIENENIEI